MKPAEVSTQTASRKVSSADGRQFLDHLAVEEPLEIRIALDPLPHRPVSITMRTPGDDLELAVGFLFTEGIIGRREDIKNVRHCIPADGVKNRQNTVVVELAPGVKIDIKRIQRNFYTSSSCGVCGKSSIEALNTGVRRLKPNGFAAEADVIRTLPTFVRRVQTTFERTGGLHASALFSADGQLEIIREDVGRHNALDKVIGARFLSGLMPLEAMILFVSGRASFELVQKALMAGIPILVAVGAPSSLAVELAAEYGMTLAGFLREDGFNIYCGGERIRNAAACRTFV